MATVTASLTDAGGFGLTPLLTQAPASTGNFVVRNGGRLLFGGQNVSGVKVWVQDGGILYLRGSNFGTSSADSVYVAPGGMVVNSGSGVFTTIYHQASQPKLRGIGSSTPHASLASSYDVGNCGGSCPAGTLYFDGNSAASGTQGALTVAQTESLIKKTDGTACGHECRLALAQGTEFTVTSSDLYTGDWDYCATNPCKVVRSGFEMPNVTYLVRHQVTLTQPPAGSGAASSSVTNPNTSITYCTGAALSAVPAGCDVTVSMSGIPAGYTAYWGGDVPCTGTTCSFRVSGPSTVRLYSGRQCGNPGNDCYTLAANDPTITSAVLPKAGGEGQVDYVTTTSGFKIWKENGGTGRILNATGLWYSASDWQQTLNRRGHQYSGSYLTNATHIGTIAGRACPSHVFKNGNYTAGSQCLYYDTATYIASLNQATGVEGDDYLTYWNTTPTGNGNGPSWYEGNIKVCADKGMRLPTLYETQANQPTYWVPSDANPTFGGTRVPSSSAWTITATANSYNAIGYWSWLGSNNGNGYRAFNIASDVRCVLP